MDTILKLNHVSLLMQERLQQSPAISFALMGANFRFAGATALFGEAEQRRPGVHFPVSLHSRVATTGCVTPNGEILTVVRRRHFA